MGLSTFPSAAEGVLPVLVMNTVLSVALLKNLVRSVLQMVGAADWLSSSEDSDWNNPTENGRERRISITHYKSLCIHNNSTRGGSAKSSTSSSSSDSTSGGWVECCVCLCGFEAEEEVSELSCKHFFHTGCLDKWFDTKTTCPLCRSIL